MAETDAAAGADALEDALGLWRGVPFEDLGPQPVLQAESSRLEELRHVAIELLMQARLAAGQHIEVVAELDRLTREHPYREELRALHMVGRKDNATAREQESCNEHPERGRQRRAASLVASPHPDMSVHLDQCVVRLGNRHGFAH